jgi:hypothetical protein
VLQRALSEIGILQMYMEENRKWILDMYKAR